MTFWVRLIIVCIMVICMNACFGVSSYHGDGFLEDKGRFDAKNRYILNLGEIEIGESGSYEFKLAGLPSEEFVFGLEVELPMVGHEENPREHLSCDPFVHIQIANPPGEEVVLDISGRIISDWTWSIAIGDPSAFLYVRGNGGKSFKPESSRHSYNLMVRINRPTGETCTLKAILVAKSPGWK